MSVRLIIIIVTLFVVSNVAILTTYGQDFHFSNLHENLFKLNPAVITQTEQLSMNLTYRNQWPGNSDFVTYDGGVFYTAENFKSTAGLYILNDNQGQGIINHTTLSLIYGYKTRMGKIYEISAGLQGAYNIFILFRIIRKMSPNITKICCSKQGIAYCMN